MLPYKLFDAESASCEWMSCCINCSSQIIIVVAHHAQIFEGVCLGELHAIIEKTNGYMG